MQFSSRKLAFAVVSMAIVVSPVVWLYGAEQATKTAATKADPQSVDMFDGIESGDILVRFIPKNDREATVVIENKTKKPLSVKLPDAFVGSPILAQNAVGGGNRTRNRNTNNNNQNQNTGGGFGGGGGGGGGGGIFNVAPEATGKMKVPIVCLEHGKEDPAAHIPYEIRPVTSFTKDANVVQLLTLLGQGNIDQRAAQAAAWHFANGMSWQELAAKKIHHLGGRGDEQYFTLAQMQMATRIANEAERLAKDHPIEKEKSDDSYSASSDTPATTGTISTGNTLRNN